MKEKKQKSIFEKIIGIIFKIFFGVICLIVAALIFSKFDLAGNYKILIVQSGSMEPAIRTGGVVIIKPASEYAVGDIITFGPATKTKTPTTHRIMEVKDDNGQISYITKGDANEESDLQTVAKGQVIGKVIFSIPFFGYVIDFAKKPLGFILIIGIPAIIIISDEIKNIFSELKRGKKKDKNKKEKSENEYVINLK